MAAKLKITPELTKKVCDNIRIGLSFEDACLLSGIQRDALRVWSKKGANQKKEYIEFAEAVDRALIECKQRDLVRIEKFSDQGGDTNALKAILWRLSRRFPREWGNKETVRHEDNNTPQDKSAFATTDNINSVLANIFEKEANEDD